MVNFLSGEFVLKFYPNGGTAVFVRSLGITCMVYAVAVSLKYWLSTSAASNATQSLPTIAAETIPWIGAIFAGTYAALYARFASQWNYLAALYNQLMAASVQCNEEDAHGRRVLNLWQAAFVEDAETLHLARKPLFASVIHDMLSREPVQKEFIKHTPNGLVRLMILDRDLAKILRRQPHFNPERRTAFCETCGADRKST